MTAALSTPPAVPTRVVIRPAPRREPPFDDELAQITTIAAGRYDQRLPFAVPRRTLPWQAPASLTALRPGALPEPGNWAHRLLIGMIETAAGRRPLHQLGALLSPSVTRGLGGDFERSAAAGSRHWLHRATVRSVRATEPAVGVAELCATVQVGQRVRAIALRLEAHHGRWRCTRLQLG